LRIRLTIAPLLSIVFHLVLHCWIPLFKTLFLFYNGHPVIFLVFEKNGENLKKNLVFKFGDSIDHGSLTKCRISLNFTLIYSSFQDASFDVNSCPVTLLVLEKNEKKNEKILIWCLNLRIR
jgi:hypothetical protein